MAESDYRFYVYKFIENDICIYIGKGSKNRLKVQQRRFGIIGEIVAYFVREKDAHIYEKQLIKLYKPLLNKTKGGEGRTHKRVVHYKWEGIIDRIGSKAYAARLLLNVYKSLPMLVPEISKIEQIRKIAYG